MDKPQKQILNAAMLTVIRRLTAKGAHFSLAEAAREVAAEIGDDKQFSMIHAQLADSALQVAIGRFVPKAFEEDESDRIQGMESLPPMKVVRGMVYVLKAIDYEHYRQTLNALDNQIRNYGYARVKKEHLKALKRQRREMKHFNRPFAKSSATDAQMTLWQAKELQRLMLDSKATRQRREANLARWRRTKNQQHPGSKK